MAQPDPRSKDELARAGAEKLARMEAKPDVVYFGGTRAEAEAIVARRRQAAHQDASRSDRHRIIETSR